MVVRSTLMLLVGVLPLAVSCSDATQPVEPRPPKVADPAEPPPAEPAPPTLPLTPPVFPPLQRPGDVYAGPHDLYDVFRANHNGALGSRFAFYGDGKFGLQFASYRFGFFEYTGAYAQHGEQITLVFDANAPDWDATATLRGDSLSVQYNFDMVMSDFIDGVYVRSPVTP